MLLNKAINVTKKSSHGGVDVYIGEMDAEWCIGVVPNGGYALGQIVEACVQRQHSSQPHHPDPIHVTAQFLHSPSVSPFEVHIRLLKEGKSFTNLEADLVQENITRITSHLIFGVLESPPIPGSSLYKNNKSEEDNRTLEHINLLPPSPYARRLPLYHHPFTATRTSFPSRLRFHNRLWLTHEPEIAARNDAGSSHRTSAGTIGGGGIETGFWCGFRDNQKKEDKHKGGEIVTASNLPLFADISPGAVLLLPKEYRKGMGISWFPTLTMTIEYKFAIPKPSKFHSNGTVGVYSSTNFLHGPMGRHTSYTEIWSAPCDVEKDVEVGEGWRDDQVCLAVSTQMAVTVPIAKNLAKEKGKL